MDSQSTNMISGGNSSQTNEDDVSLNNRKMILNFGDKAVDDEDSSPGIATQDASK